MAAPSSEATARFERAGSRCVRADIPPAAIAAKDGGGRDGKGIVRGTAPKHWEAFSKAFDDPDPELRPLLDEARAALAAAKGMARSTGR